MHSSLRDLQLSTCQSFHIPVLSFYYIQSKSLKASQINLILQISSPHLGKKASLRQMKLGHSVSFKFTCYWKVATAIKTNGVYLMIHWHVLALNWQ